MMHQSMNLNAVQAIYQFNFFEIRKNWYAVKYVKYALIVRAQTIITSGT